MSNTTENLQQSWRAATLISASDLSASSSETSLLHGGTGLQHWAVTGDLLLEEDDEEENFFWDLVTESFSSDVSSLAEAFRMLLKEKFGQRVYEIQPNASAGLSFVMLIQNFLNEDLYTWYRFLQCWF